MKAILTCYAIFSFGLLVQAQENLHNGELSAVNLLENLEKKEGPQLKKRVVKKRSMARLYLLKNSRAKKELAFKTKRNKSKLT